MSLGLPGGIETRKKAHLGVDMDGLLARYKEAERKRDLPEMLALLDIIRAAPKKVEGPTTTVKDDLMAAVQPRPAPAGVQGALTAMENQNQAAPVMAADGGFMGYGDDNEPVEMSKGGAARFFLGGAGTVAPYSSMSALSLADIERMAMMGDPEAQKELSNRMRANIPRATTPGAGPTITTPQTTDQFGPRGKIPVAGAPAAGAPAAATRSGIGALLSKIPGAGFISRHPYATAITAATTLGQPLVDRLMATDQGTPSEELDPIAAMQGTQGGIDRTAPGQAQFTPPAARDPGAAAVVPPAAPPVPPGARTPPAPALPFSLADLKPKTIEDYINEKNAYEEKRRRLDPNLRTFEDIKQDFEKFRTEGKERAEADRATAKEAFKDELLLSAALAAPQFLKGRGLAQATARASEAFSPLAQRAMTTQSAALKEATKMERDTADKFRLAQIDLDKAYRSEELGKFDKAAALRDSSLKTYTQAALDKYKADIYYQVGMGSIARQTANDMYDAAEKLMSRLQLNSKFKNLDSQAQQRIINSILQGVTNPGGSGRPPILDVPGQ